MARSRSVSATFTLAPHVRINATSYATLQAAYNAARNRDTIMLMEGSRAGTLTANRAIDISVTGGYNSGYSAHSGHTALLGSISVQQGSVRMGGVALK
jgi:hypothetical protein